VASLPSDITGRVNKKELAANIFKRKMFLIDNFLPGTIDLRKHAVPTSWLLQQKLSNCNKVKLSNFTPQVKQARNQSTVFLHPIKNL